MTRRRQAAALALSACALVALAACKNYPPATTTTSTTTTTTEPPLCRTQHCSSAASVQRLFALAERGAELPLQATYRYLGAKSAPFTFEYATIPGPGVLSYFPPRAEYLFEAEADFLRYEFVSNRSGYFECLSPLGRTDWTCRGPVRLAGGGLGAPATVGSYDVEPDLVDYLGPPLARAPLVTRLLDGFKVTCVSYTEGVKPVPWTWCVTAQGVLAYLSGPSFLRGIELVTLSLGAPAGDFALPARPGAWTGFEAGKVPAFAPPGFRNVTY